MEKVNCLFSNTAEPAPLKRYKKKQKTKNNIIAL